MTPERGGTRGLKSRYVALGLSMSALQFFSIQRSLSAKHEASQMSTPPDVIRHT